MRFLLDTGIRALARFLLAVFYRSIEVVGRENIPASGPVLLVANHGNALVDPALVVAHSPRMPRFLAKHLLFSHPLVRPLLSWAGAVPVYRRQDGVSSRANLSTFARCHDELADGGVIALFPEGISHHQPRLQPLKTGAARIALEAERERGPLGIEIVPIGLIFEEKERFRSRALVVIGEPFGVEAELRASRAGESAARDAARRLTERIASALESVTLNTETWEEQSLAGRASEIVGRDTDEPEAPLQRDFALRREALGVYRALLDDAPERAERLREQLRSYEDHLARRGFRDEQLASPHPSFWVRHAAPQVLLLALWAPVALLGSLINYLPFRFVAQVAARVEDTPDQPATHKVMAGMVLFPLCWAAAALWMGFKAGPVAGWMTAAAMPAIAWFALRYHESGLELYRNTRTYLDTRRDPDAVERLRQERGALREALQAERPTAS